MPMPDERWLMLAVLFSARLALGLSFQSAGSAAPFLMEAFEIDLARVGTLVGLFMLPGIVLAIPAGKLGSRFGDKRMVLVGLAMMVTGAAASGFAIDWTVVMAGRLLLGIGAVFLVVLMTKMVFDWFVGRELFVAMSIFIIGWPVGHAAGQFALTVLAAEAGWPMAFHVAALSCALALLLLTAFYRPPAGAAARVQAPLTALTRRELRLVTIAGLLWMILNGSYVLFLGFGPMLLIERGATATAGAGVASLMPWAFLIALPLGGWIATRWNAPNIVMVGGLATSAVLGGLIAAGATGAVFLPLGFAIAFGTATMSALPSEALREELRASGLGYYFVWYFIGSAAFPVIGGYASDAFESSNAAIVLGAGGMALCLALLLVFRSEQARASAAAAPGAAMR